MNYVFAAERVEKEAAHSTIYSCHSVFYWASVPVVAEARDPEL